MPSHYNVLTLLVLAIFINKIICGGDQDEPQYILLRHGKKVAEPTLHEVLQMEKSEAAVRQEQAGGEQQHPNPSTLLPGVVDFVEPLTTDKSNNLLPDDDSSLLPSADLVEPATKSNTLLPNLDFIDSRKSNSLHHGVDFEYDDRSNRAKSKTSLFFDNRLNHDETKFYHGKNSDDSNDVGMSKEFIRPLEDIYATRAKTRTFFRNNDNDQTSGALPHRDDNKDTNQLDNEQNTLRRRVTNHVYQNFDGSYNKREKDGQNLPAFHSNTVDIGLKRESNPNSRNALLDEMSSAFDFNGQNTDFRQQKMNENIEIKNEIKSKFLNQEGEYDINKSFREDAVKLLPLKQKDSQRYNAEKMSAYNSQKVNSNHLSEEKNKLIDKSAGSSENPNLRLKPKSNQDNFETDEHEKENFFFNEDQEKIDTNTRVQVLNKTKENEGTNNKKAILETKESGVEDIRSKNENRIKDSGKPIFFHAGTTEKVNGVKRLAYSSTSDDSVEGNIKALKENEILHDVKEFSVGEKHLDALSEKYGFGRFHDNDESGKIERKDKTVSQEKDTRKRFGTLEHETNTKLGGLPISNILHHNGENNGGLEKKISGYHLPVQSINVDKSKKSNEFHNIDKEKGFMQNVKPADKVEKTNELHRIDEENSYMQNAKPAVDEFPQTQKLKAYNSKAEIDDGEKMSNKKTLFFDNEIDENYPQTKLDESEKLSDGLNGIKPTQEFHKNTFETEPMFGLLQSVEKQHIKSDTSKPQSEHIAELIGDDFLSMEVKNSLYDKQRIASSVAKKATKPVVKVADKRKDFPVLVRVAEKAIRRGLPELPDLATLLSKDTKTGIKYEFNDCEFEIVNDGCKILFIPKEETCMGKISLSKLLGFLTKEDVIKSDLTNLIPIQVFQVERFKIDKCDGDAEFETIATESFYVIKEEIKIYPEDHHINNEKRNYTDLRMKIKKSHLILNFNSKEIIKHFQFKRIGIDLQGDVEIAGETHSIIVTKSRHDEEMRFLIKLNSISVSQFANAFTWRKFSDDEIMKSLDQFLDVGIADPIVTGRTFTDGSYELTLKGRTQNMSGYGEMPANIVVKKEIGEPISLAVLVEIKRIKPVVLLSELTGKDLLNVPLLKDLSEKFLLEFSNADIGNITDVSINKMMRKHATITPKNGVVVTKGIKLKLFVPVKRIFQASSLIDTNMSSLIDYEKIPDLIPIQIHLENGVLNFRFPKDAFMDLHDIVSALMPSSSENLFKQILKVSTVISISKFNIDLTTKDVDVVAKGPKSVILGDDVIKLENAEFRLKHKRKGSWEFQINAIKRIASEQMKVKVVRKGETFQLIGEIKNLTTKAIDGHFGKAYSKVFEEMEFLNFQVYDVKMQLQFGNTTSIQVTGVPSLFNWDSTFEGYIFDSEVESDDKPKMSFGVVIKNIQLEEILDNFLETRIMHSSWMPKADVVLEISNLDADEVNFTAPDLRKITSLHNARELAYNPLQVSMLNIICNSPNEWIDDLIFSELNNLNESYEEWIDDLIFSELNNLNGAWLYTSIYVPSDCKSEVFCEMLQEKTQPDTVFDLKGELTASGCELRSKYRGKISFGEQFQLDHVKLIVRVKNVRENTHNTQVWMEGVMRIKTPRIAFNGRLSVGRSGKVELKLTMRGRWRNPYSLPYISFDSLQMNVAVQSDAFLPKLELVGEMLLGRRHSQDVIRANAAIGFNPLNKADNFFYAQIDPFTIKELVDAMGFEVKLPAVLSVAGFPGGLVVGFTANPKGKRVEHLNSDINHGITIKGGLNIMGMMLQCRLSIRYPHELTINASVSPLKLGGGLISLRKNADDLETGPKLYIRITNSSATVRMEGYAELLGISDNIAVLMDDGMEFKMQGLMFNLLPANISVFDPFSTEILKKSEFQVSSCLPTVYQDVAIQVTNILSDASDLTTKNMQIMQHEINSAASWHHLAWNKLKKWTSVLKEKETKLQKKSEILHSLKDSFKINCVEQCPLTCVGGPTTNVKCKKVLNTWFPCFEWDECKKKIDDPACIATCVGKKVYNEAKVAKKKASMIGVGNTITSVKKLAKHIKNFLMKSLDLVYITDKAAVTIEKIAVYGGRAVNLMANYTKDDVIDVRQICFNTSLDKATSACFDMDISVELASKEVYDLKDNACIDVNFVQNIGKWISDEIFPGILSLRRKFKEGRRFLKQVRKLKGTLERERIENEKIEKEVEQETNDLEEYEEIDDEEESLRGNTRESVIPKHTEDFLRHQLYGFYPSVQIQDDSISDAFEKKSPWAYAKTDSPFILKKPTGYEDEEAAKKDHTPAEILRLAEVENTPRCFQIGSVISTYHVIAETIEVITKKFIEERKAYVDELKNYSEKAAQVEDEIVKDCIKVNMSNDRMEDALYYVKRLKTGIVDWSKTVEHQLEAQDREALQMWRKSFMELMNGKRNLDIPKLLEILNSVSMSAMKRQIIPLKDEKDSEFAQSFTEATKQVNDLLIGDLGSLTERKDSLYKFSTLTRYLQHNIGNICPL